jgi:tRNA dimethylallyltransferase
MMPEARTPPVLAVVGPTASGKSAVALALAAEIGAEIISCDSVQVYRGFEIGCAKPTAVERAQTPHHLIDVAAWNEPFDAQRYRTLAIGALAAIGARERVAIVCGGTGLYLRALRYGLADVPSAPPELRAALYAEEAGAPGSLYRRLLQIDPESARHIEPNNIVHVARALEIHAACGRPASLVRSEHGFAAELVPMRVVALRWPAAALRARIEERTGAMLEAGLLDEVQQLLAAGVAADSRPMRSVGYKEAVAVLSGSESSRGLAERIARSTWAYARRQLSWLRRERDVEWLDVTSPCEAVAALRASGDRA